MAAAAAAMATAVAEAALDDATPTAWLPTLPEDALELPVTGKVVDTAPLVEAGKALILKVGLPLECTLRPLVPGPRGRDPRVEQKQSVCEWFRISGSEDEAALIEALREFFKIVDALPEDFGTRGWYPTGASLYNLESTEGEKKTLVGYKASIPPEAALGWYEMLERDRAAAVGEKVAATEAVVAGGAGATASA